MLSREKIINDLKAEKRFDIIIIGGGSVGLGTGVEAVARGYKTLVLEKYDFAKGTSSRSTKLLHGGVRYLAQFHFSLVKDSLHEKERLFNNAPHLTEDCEFIVPCYNVFDLGLYRSGLFLYDILAGFPKGHTSSLLTKGGVVDRYPNIKQKSLLGGISYHDGVFDDSRLALALMNTILDLGGLALNYAEVVNFIKEHEKIVGVIVKDTETNEEYEIRGSCVVNATGIFSDSVRSLDNNDGSSIVQQAQGIHLMLPYDKFNSRDSLLIPKTDDGRVLFTVPWHGEVIVGTTDTKMNTPKIEPIALEEEINFIIKNLNKYLENSISKADILSIYAGMRPLIKESAENTSAVSREEKIVISDSKLVSIVGGKWTSYRRMCEKLVDSLIAHKFLTLSPSKTINLQLHGYVTRIEAQKIPDYLRTYGSNLSKLKEINGFDTKIHQQAPYNEAQILYALRYEQARTVDDFLARRTRFLFLNATHALGAAPRVAEIMAKELNKDANWEQNEVNNFTVIAKNYLAKNYF